MTDLNVEIIRESKPARDKPWEHLEILWTGIVPWIPRVGETVAWTDCGYDGTVKHVYYDLDGRKVTVELE